MSVNRTPTEALFFNEEAARRPASLVSKNRRRRTSLDSCAFDAWGCGEDACCGGEGAGGCGEDAWDRGEDAWGCGEDAWAPVCSAGMPGS
jgi:hypothetical protein